VSDGGEETKAETHELTAYRIRQEEDWTVVPAVLQRDWMPKTLNKAALRCLPLGMANQAGWFVTSPASFRAQWTSRSDAIESLSIKFPSKADERYKNVIKSNFGSGIITFVLPFLFRTTPGIGMLVRGPANWPRPDVVALEGFVETDWSPYPFTMNWKITRPKVDVSFKKGDPICMITPFPMGLLEQMKPRIRPLQSDHELNKNFVQAAERRHDATQRGDTWEGKYELTYTRGFRPDGVEAPEHRTNLKLQDFVEFQY
jgi:hypothetical protein